MNKTDANMKPRSCQQCGWYPDTLLFVLGNPLTKCVSCGLWLCTGCHWAHNCAGQQEYYWRRSDGERGFHIGTMQEQTFTWAAVDPELIRTVLVMVQRIEPAEHIVIDASGQTMDAGAFLRLITPRSE